VAGGEVGGEDCAAKGHRVAVVQDAVDMGRRKVHVGLVAVLEVGFAARLDDGDVGVHDIVFGAGELLDAGAAGAVVVVGVADEQDLDVAKMEAEGLDALLDEGHAGFKVAIDENVALERDEEIGGEVFAADIVEVAGDAEGGKGFGPAGSLEGGLGGEQEGRGEKYEKQNWPEPGGGCGLPILAR
jgi:hypothetical protein